MTFESAALTRSIAGKARLAAVAVGLALALSAPAFAQDAHHAESPAHTEGAAHEGAAHEEGAAHAEHVDWTGDLDNDGVPNWRDSTTGSEPNEHYMVRKLAWHLFNLLVILGVIFWMARRPVTDAIRNRAHDIRKEITDAARMRDEAMQRHEELGARLARFEDEVAQMKAAAAEEARQEEQKLVDRARAEAVRIQQTAERSIRDEVVRAQVALRKEAVDLAVQLAEQTLRAEVGPEDHKRLARQFLASLTPGSETDHG